MAIPKRKGHTPQVGRSIFGKSHTLKKVCLMDSGGGKKSPLSPKDNNTHRHRKYPIYVATYNARTLSTNEKMLELEEELTNIKWDILGLSEVRRIGEGQITLDKGHIFHYAGEETAIRGVGFLVHKRHTESIINIKSISPRVLFITIQLNKKYSLKIIQAYAPTSDHTEEDIECFYEDISSAIQDEKSHYTLLIGDFNAKIGSKIDEAENAVGHHGLGERNERGNTLIDFLHSKNLFAMNTFFQKNDNKKWTWMGPDGRTKNAIDFICSSRKDIVSDVDVLNRFSTGSDHRLVRAKIKLNIRKERNNMILKKSHKKWNLPKNVYKYEQQLSKSLNVNDRMTVNAIYENITNSVNTTIEKCCKSKNKNQKLNLRTKSLMKQRRELTDKTTIEYRSINKEIAKEIRKHKREQNTESIKTTIEENKSLKVLARKNLARRNNIYKIKNTDGRIVTNKKEITQTIEAFYKRLYSTPNREIKSNIPIILNQGSEDLEEINDDEIISALKDMKSNKAPGEDEMVIESIKMGGQDIINALKTLFNKCLSEGTIPSQWESAQIIIIHKKGDNTNLENYRPISLLSHIYKLYTKIITTRLTNKLEFFLSREQAGFRTKYGTNDHLLTMKLIIEKCIEYNKPLMLIFIDFKKAFDTVDHQKLLEALAECRIDYRYSSAIKYIYTTSTAYVKINNNQHTNKFKIERGLRQGDALSPKLFVTLLQSVLNKIRWNNMGINIDGENLSHLCFADDIVLITDDTAKAQTMLQNLQTAAEKVGLEINLSKTQYMTNLVLSNSLKINNINIEQTYSYKYLGHEISIERDNQTREIQRRIGLTWAAFGKLKSVFRSNLPICLKRKVFNQCVLPVLTYGAETLTLTRKNITKIQVMQRRMERSMLGITLRDRVPNTTIRLRTKTRDAVETILHLKWNWAGHVARMTDNRWTKKIAEWRPRQDAYRNRGRPPTRWSDDIRRTAGNWILAAQERGKWKHLREAFVQQWTV